MRITSGLFKGQHIGFLEEQNLMPIEMKIDGAKHASLHVSLAVLCTRSQQRLLLGSL